MDKAVLLGAAHSIAFKMSRAAHSSSRVELVGVYDENTVLRDAASEGLEVPGFRSLDEALGTGPSVALVGSVPAQRAELARRALEAGAAVLIDNPSVLTHEALDGLMTAVERSGRSVVTYQPARGEPLMLAARSAFDAGRIGDLVRVFANGPHKISVGKRKAWHWTRAGNGGILIDIGGHGFDTCCWFADADPETISAVHANTCWPRHPEFQDFGQARIRFSNGVLANIEVDWLTADSMKTYGDARLWLQGTKGKIEVTMGDQVSAKIWTDEAAGADLDLPTSKGDAWTVHLIEDLAAGHDCAILQHEVWRPARAALLAFESAEAGGRLVGWR